MKHCARRHARAREQARHLGIEHEPTLSPELATTFVDPETRVAGRGSELARLLIPQRPPHGSPLPPKLAALEAEAQARAVDDRATAPKTERNTRGPGSEHHEQKRLFRTLRAHRIAAFHVPNGEDRSQATGGALQETGVEGGVPDVVVLPAFRLPKDAPADTRPESIDGAVALVIEMKAPGERPKTDRAHRWSKAKPHQREWLAIFEIAGLSAFVCYSAEHALCVLAEHGYPVDTADTGGVR